MLKSDEKSRKTKVLRMGWRSGQNVRTPQESLFMLSRGPHGPYMNKNQKIRQKSLFLLFALLTPDHPL